MAISFDLFISIENNSIFAIILPVIAPRLQFSNLIAKRIFVVVWKANKMALKADVCIASTLLQRVWQADPCHLFWDRILGQGVRVEFEL